MAEKTGKPKIDEVVGNILCETNLENALDLISFIKENKISLRWSSTNCWQLYYKSKRIGLIRMTEKAYPMYALGENSWSFVPWGLDDILDAVVADTDKTKEIIWNNVRQCSSCCGCGPGHERIFLGKKFEKACHSGIFMINPDKATIDCIKRMLEIKKRQLSNPA